MADVARDLGVNDGMLGRWIADERRRNQSAAAHDDQPLSPAERTELARMRKQVAEQEKDIAFLKKGVGWGYLPGRSPWENFAANQQMWSVSS
ncbi:hypothetical protein ACWFRB_17715 [Rhodococcus sp. NPDC055112]